MDTIIQFGYDAFGVFLAIAAVLAILFILYLLLGYVANFFSVVGISDSIKLLLLLFVGGAGLYAIGYVVYGLYRSMQ